jgi:hypothetical protein
MLLKPFTETRMKNLNSLALPIFLSLLLFGTAACGSSNADSGKDAATQDQTSDVAADDLIEDKGTPPDDLENPEDLQKDNAELAPQDETSQDLCTPACDGKQCGDDGCGDFCGQCEEDFQCNDLGQCEPVPCEPDCSWKQCGNDGCDGSCGECEENFYCGPAFQCIPFDCTPDCFSKECGWDGCSGSCGECLDGFQCSDEGKCVCIPDCDGKACGDDGCGGSCGSCPGTNYCFESQCHIEGTYHDHQSDLVWQVTPYATEVSWTDAQTICDGLDLDGTGWRLPTIMELRSLVRGCPAVEPQGTCNIADDGCLVSDCRDASCAGCEAATPPACYWPEPLQGACHAYWSSSSTFDVFTYAWHILFSTGELNLHNIADINHYVRCVRTK